MSIPISFFFSPASSFIRLISASIASNVRCRDSSLTLFRGGSDGMCVFMVMEDTQTNLYRQTWQLVQGVGCVYYIFSSVDFASVPNPTHKDCFLIVVNVVDDAIIAQTNAPSQATLHFQTSRGTRILAQCAELGNNVLGNGG